MADYSWIRPGAKVVARVVDAPDGDGNCSIETGDNGFSGRVGRSALSPLPAPDPITDAERRVVEAAKDWERRMAWRYPGLAWSEVAQPLADAVYALRAAQTPPDPVAELRAIVDVIDNCAALPKMILSRARAAIAAVEAKMKPWRPVVGERVRITEAYTGPRALVGSVVPVAEFDPSRPDLAAVQFPDGTIWWCVLASLESVAL